MKFPFINRFKSEREKTTVSLIKNRFGVAPRNVALYNQAFCHKSAARNFHNNRHLSNERLEFLGDAVIDAVVAEYLYVTHTKADEGELTKMKSRIVNRANLNAIAVAIGVDQHIETDMQAASSTKSIAGNTLEAIIGAIYLDRGYKRAKSSTLSVLMNHADLGSVTETESDYKSRLYEEAHRLNARVFFDTKPVDSKKGTHMFTAQALWNGEVVGQGKGSSKKRAEQQAAQVAFENINE
ncbi:MAG: ribonuclease III [Flavobacteriales bacterium]|nr:ribonuclease III [Flavobacteriales bacterium]